MGTKTINRNILLSITASLAAKLLVLAQSAAVTALYGANPSVDIYFYLMSVLVVLTSACSSLNQLVFVPGVIQIRAQSSQEDSFRFLSLVYWLYVGFSLAVGLSFLFGGEWFLMTATKFPTEAIQANGPAIRLMAFVAALSMANSFLLDICISFKVFVLPMVNDVVKSMLIILFVLLPGDRSITVICAGILAANLLQCVSMHIVLFRVSGFQPTLGRFSLTSLQQRNILYVLCVQPVIMLDALVEMRIMSGYDGGYYTAMDLARKVCNIAYSVIVVQLATVVGIHLLERHAAGEREQLAASFLQYLKAGLYLLIPLSMTLAIHARPAMDLLFGRGKYSAEYVSISAAFFAILIFSLPLRLADNFVQKLITAMQIHRLTLTLLVITNALSIGLLFGLSRLLGYMAVPVTVLAVNIFYILLLYCTVLRREFSYIPLGGLLRSAAVNTFAAFLVGLAGLRLTAFIYSSDHNFWAQLILMALTVSGMLAVFYLLSALFPDNRQMLLTAWKKTLGFLRRHRHPL